MKNTTRSKEIKAKLKITVRKISELEKKKKQKLD